MKKNELNKLSSEDLIVMLKDNQEALVNLKFQKALQQLDHPSPDFRSVHFSASRRKVKQFR